MANVKKLKNPVTVTTVLEEEQYEALRLLAYKEHRSMAELFRTAIEDLIAQKAQKQVVAKSEKAR